MQFDKQSHKELALSAIENVNIPGKLVDAVYEYKQAVINSTVAETQTKDTGKPSRALKNVKELGGPVTEGNTAPEKATELTQETISEASEGNPTTNQQLETATAPKRPWPARKPRGV